jgi:hypothetical protein
MPGSSQGLRLLFSQLLLGHPTPENASCGDAFDGSSGHLAV